MELISGKVRAAAGLGWIGGTKCRERCGDGVRRAAHARNLSFLRGIQEKIETSRAQCAGRRASCM